MINLDARVTVTMPDGTRIHGTVFSFEDGRQLGARHGGRYEGWVYEVVPDGQATLWPRVRAREEDLEAIE